MINSTRRGLVVVGAVLLLGGCVTGQEKTSDLATGHQTDDCSSLTESRRRLAVQMDAIESGKVGPGTLGSVLTTVAVLGAKPYQMGALGGYAAKDRENALGDMRTRETNLREEIEAKECTAVARVKAGKIRATDSAQYDGDYAGKGQTDSWCAQPSLSLEIRSGRVSGLLHADAKAKEAYDVVGQLYDDGELSLEFMRPQSHHYTDDFDGTLKDGVLSFTAKLDLSPKACVYRFAIKHRP